MQLVSNIKGIKQLGYDHTIELKINKNEQHVTLMCRCSYASPFLRAFSSFNVLDIIQFNQN